MTRWVEALGEVAYVAVGAWGILALSIALILLGVVLVVASIALGRRWRSRRRGR